MQNKTAYNTTNETSTMPLYPLQLNVRGRRCVIIGAGRVAGRKAAGLTECGADVLVVAPQAGEGVKTLADTGRITWLPEAYRAAHLDGARLAFAATDSPAVNAQVTRDAQARGVLVCDASDPDAGDFVSPAVVRRGALTLTASTEGASPTLAAVVRERLERAFGPEWEPLTALVGRLRGAIQAAGDEDARRQAVQQIIDDETVRALLAQGNTKEAEARAKECCS